MPGSRYVLHGEHHCRQLSRDLNHGHPVAKPDEGGLRQPIILIPERAPKSTIVTTLRKATT